MNPDIVCPKTSMGEDSKLIGFWRVSCRPYCRGRALHFKTEAYVGWNFGRLALGHHIHSYCSHAVVPGLSYGVVQFCSAKRDFPMSDARSKGPCFGGYRCNYWELPMSAKAARCET
eukprot:2806273-Amphidinium_carterae.2